MKESQETINQLRNAKAELKQLEGKFEGGNEAQRRTLLSILSFLK